MIALLSLACVACDAPKPTASVGRSEATGSSAKSLPKPEPPEPPEPDPPTEAVTRPTKILLVPPPFEKATVLVNLQRGARVVLLDDPQGDPSPAGMRRVKVRDTDQRGLEGWIPKSALR